MRHLTTANQTANHTANHTQDLDVLASAPDYHPALWEPEALQSALIRNPVERAAEREWLSADEFYARHAGARTAAGEGLQSHGNRKLRGAAAASASAARRAR